MLGRLGHRVEVPLLIPQLAAAVGELLGQRGVAGLPGLAHLLGEGLDLGPVPVAVADGGPGLLVEVGQPVELGRIHPPADEGGLHRGEVVPHQPDIDHDGHNGSVTTRGRRQ